jgi:hypothetical protein
MNEWTIPERMLQNLFVGTLFFASNITLFLGPVVFIKPLFNSPDYIELVFANNNLVTL